MENDLADLFSFVEDGALEELSNAITIDANTRLPRLMRRLRLKKILNLYDIRVVGISFRIEVDDDTRQELIERKESIENEENKEDSPNYYG